VTYNQKETAKNSDIPSCAPVPMERNYSKIWAKYSDYNERNTVMISNYYNQIEDF